jgi:hypothetical protein
MYFDLRSGSLNAHIEWQGWGMNFREKNMSASDHC